MKKRIFIVLLTILFACAGLYLTIDQRKKTFVTSDVSRVLSEDSDSNNYKRALHPRQFSFPKDLGPHNDFQTEWWYFTGNLHTSTERLFGYQLTFFRRAISDKPASGQSNWRSNQLYMAHFAVSDINQNSFLSFERFSRGSMGLAGANGSPFRVWLEDWEVTEVSSNSWMLKARADGVTLHISLNPLKPMILNGKQGLSQKGPEAGNASYYYSNTRIETQGHLSLAGQTFSVTGNSWLDREWSTSALSQDQIGWDWFSIQLDDLNDIMLFQIRYKDGGVSRFSSGSFIDYKGIVSHLNLDQFKIDVLDYWQSPISRKRYPSAWKIQIPSKQLSLIVTPMMNDQEHHHSFSYWEGAVKVNGPGVSGVGYVEMTGY